MIPTNILHDNAAIGNDISILHDIHLKTKNIAVYQRGIASLKEGLAKAAQMPIECRASGTVEEITLSLSSYFANALHLSEALLGDILNLLRLFGQVTGVSSFRVVLATVSTTMCPRFHADHNELRMLCTYYGPGTLWLPNHALDRKAYLTGKDNKNILLDKRHIQQVDTGDVLILKGGLYPGAAPALHRSPNIEESDKGRILLSIDTNASLNLPT